MSPDTADTSVIIANLGSPEHAGAVRNLLNRYALDLEGYRKALPDAVLADLVPEMRKIPTHITFLARRDDAYAGLATCFLGFSTFVARPLINIHDFAVVKEHRGKGIGTALLTAVEAEAKRRGCCKLTLETQTSNTAAQRLYERFGFANNVPGMPDEDRSLFYVKTIA